MALGDSGGGLYTHTDTPFNGTEEDNCCPFYAAVITIKMWDSQRNSRRFFPSGENLPGRHLGILYFMIMIQLMLEYDFTCTFTVLFCFFWSTANFGLCNTVIYFSHGAFGPIVQRDVCSKYLFISINSTFCPTKLSQLSVLLIILKILLSRKSIIKAKKS